MQLTPEQLDIAARKLCELSGTDPNTVGNVNQARARITEHVIKYGDRLAAIIHAVTSETIGSRTDNERFAWLATTCSGAGFHEISSSAHKKWVSRPAIGNIARAFRESIDEVIYDIEGTQQKGEPAKCTKCSGEGWLWWYERDDRAGHDSTEWVTDDTRYPCDACQYGELFGEQQSDEVSE